MGASDKSSVSWLDSVISVPVLGDGIFLQNTGGVFREIADVEGVVIIGEERIPGNRVQVIGLGIHDGLVLILKGILLQLIQGNRVYLGKAPGHAAIHRL